jgi:hypothetical protein
MLIALLIGKPVSIRAHRLTRAGGTRTSKTRDYRRMHASSYWGYWDDGYMEKVSAKWHKGPDYNIDLDEAWLDINSMVYEQTCTMRSPMPTYTADRWEYEQDRYYEEVLDDFLFSPIWDD